MTISHRSIKRFFIDGEIHDEACIPRLKNEYTLLLTRMMKSKGYLVRYDIDPDFTIEYNGKAFDFKLSVYGVFVGKKRAEWFDGLDKNNLVANCTQKSKSEEQSPLVA